LLGFHSGRIEKSGGVERFYSGGIAGVAVVSLNVTASFATGRAAGVSGGGMVAIAMVAVGCRRGAPTLVDLTRFKVTCSYRSASETRKICVSIARDMKKHNHASH
jgi:hypothetical protein